MDKIRKPRPFERNMIIVCEDSITAPNYLAELRKKAIENGCWDYIEILPKPLIVTENEIVLVKNLNKTERKKRQLRNINDEDWINIEVETEHREQPVLYIRTVQLAIADGSYSEGWAVFDLDGHTGHERAALMASNLPIVNVAFSSRSIEMWFLLHFGQYQTVFPKVHCKDSRKRELNCNANQPCLDDENSECLIGFLRRNTPLSNYKKNENVFTQLHSHLRNAINNAEWLRNTYQLN
jgi:RloB-like protein